MAQDIYEFIVEQLGIQEDQINFIQRIRSLDSLQYLRIGRLNQEHLAPRPVLELASHIFIDSYVESETVRGMQLFDYLSIGLGRKPSSPVNPVYTPRSIELRYDFEERVGEIPSITLRIHGYQSAYSHHVRKKTY